MSNLIDSHKWRRLGWPRIVLYILCAILVLHLLQSFASSSSPSKPSNVLPETEQQRSSVDFPWYNEQHPNMAPLQNPKYTTAHLTTQERDALQTSMVEKARVAASEFQVTGIPGSVMNTASKAKKFRSLVDCWTTGSWVEDTAHYTMPHFQDPIYGSCDRKYKKSGGTSVRPAVRYTWKSQCDMINVDAQHWCQVLRGRHLLLVGDLVQYQLHELFLDTLRDGPAVCFGELNCKGMYIQDFSSCKPLTCWNVKIILYVRNQRPVSDISAMTSCLCVERWIRIMDIQQPMSLNGTLHHRV